MIDRPKTPTFLLWFGGAACIVATYILVATRTTSAGFPLDDGWIHQVFARNLARYGEFAYNVGQPVAGSTAPLWTLLLAPGYLLGGFSLIWTYALGSVFLALCGIESYKLALYLGAKPSVAVATGIFVLFEWRMVWAGASGMEIGLFTFGTLFLVRRYFVGTPSFWLGLIGGTLTLVRPEGMVLLGLVGIDLLWKLRSDWQKVIREYLLVSAGWLLLVMPYFVFNYALSGSILPNTFGAKTNAYIGSGLLTYFQASFQQVFLVGPLFLLLPGLILVPKNQRRLLIWPLVLFGLYAFRLPVTYHHARYLMPIIPFLAICGISGIARIMIWLQQQRLPIVARSLPYILGLGLLASWVNGIQTYQFDLKFINDEQVRIGQWLAINAPPDALIATHDIGAIAYFGERKILDTAGLISPEFVPIVQDQTRIFEQVQTSKANYFVLFQSWYPKLYEQLEKTNQKVFEPQETYLAQFGEKNMAVYKLR